MCVKCRGAEGSLPTHCPGRHMTSDEEQAVMDGTLDYKGGQWTVQMVPEAETVAGRPRPRLADLDKMI